MASEPTRGPYDLATDSTPVGAEWPSAFFGTTTDDPDGYDPCLLICSFNDTDCSFEEAIANARLVKAAFNASTAARDLGFDAIGAVEALPLLIEACRKANSCASLPDAVKQLCREAVSAARKRGDAMSKKKHRRGA